MNLGWMSPGALIAAIRRVALGARKVFWGKPSGWPGAGLIVVVGAAAVFLASVVIVAIILYLVWAFACGWGRGPCL